ncbi:MAG: hypothetical protein H3C27_11880 [Opitutaceae bacterium]|nr:hypothetical protein [Opitutaceae bacterium]
MRHWLAGLICLTGWLSARAESPTCVIELLAGDTAALTADQLPIQRLDLAILDGQKNRAAATMGDTTLAVAVEARAQPENQWRVHLGIELTQWQNLPGVAEPTPTRIVLNTAVKLESGGEAQTVGELSARMDDGMPVRRVVTVRLVP